MSVKNTPMPKLINKFHRQVYVWKRIENYLSILFLSDLYSKKKRKKKKKLMRPWTRRARKFPWGPSLGGIGGPVRPKNRPIKCFDTIALRECCKIGISKSLYLGTKRERERKRNGIFIDEIPGKTSPFLWFIFFWPLEVGAASLTSTKPIQIPLIFVVFYF